MSTSKTNKVVQKVEDRVLIKYVRKAKMYCKTTFKDGKQSQEWTLEKPQ